LTNPYKSLEKKAFWRSAVADVNLFDIAQLWTPKHPIRKKHPVATFGSCFAQHIGRALEARGYSWMDTEPAPKALSTELASTYNYHIFTCRTGNLYTTSLLNQWVDWASGNTEAPSEVWEKDGRFYDPFRPNIEPNGFASAEEMMDSRAVAIDAFLMAITKARVFVFTLGLTESWINSDQGYEYPMCPGTVAGTFDESQHKFVNQSYKTIKKNLELAIAKMRKLNPKLKFILTVSPVPLTATMSGKHVLVATTESKSKLRAVAGQVAETEAFVDYFPSYEIIASPPYKGTFFEPNQRSVNLHGVATVMDQFFNCLNAQFPRLQKSKNTSKNKKRIASAKTDDVVCEEELLDAFN